jgi:glycosyltransferase involved in cell wall biosynthesis
MYKLYYTEAEEQSAEYAKLFHLQTKFLAKCGNFDLRKKHLTVNDPIRIVYAGKLYCGRWKTLEVIAKAIDRINEESIRISLEIYTQSPIRKRYQRYLDNKKDSVIKGRVSPDELTEIYEKADIALHVESFGIKYRLATRYSLSSKIIDCLSTGCAVMAVCWRGHNGLKYLKKEDAAIAVDNKKEIYKVLNNIVNNTSVISDYAEKALRCGIRNHERSNIQNQISMDLQGVISSYGNGIEYANSSN